MSDMVVGVVDTISVLSNRDGEVKLYLEIELSLNEAHKWRVGYVVDVPSDPTNEEK